MEFVLISWIFGGLILLKIFIDKQRENNETRKDTEKK
jgi:hypothetical protein